ncbi:30S ribosomal protein S17 [Parachlamydia sp. AcF125]|uniref:30S ribosomal protein S17 n=1 Tax=Parachlamydia sp. AcF125 TaxID=2795736 RepID=UPI001BC8D015|nr:30S ribosomal protein S17 [Parachlamydia sp. AcF125]MBS4167445.1 30S ribosomal protein S17 [Parachlamydia sp. AcF125]
MQENQSKRKVKKGTVLSNKMEKTVVVQVSRTYPHPRYGKVVTRNKKYYAHNELRPLQVGEQVTIEETRPLSKLKRWRVVA